MTLVADLLTAARERRANLTRALLVEGTDCFRLFHGAVEGRPGLTVDRYGATVLVQTFREPLADDELAAIRELHALPVFYNHRGPEPRFDPSPAAQVEGTGLEVGLKYALRPRHRGKDPWLFLDFRAGRRWVKDNAGGARVLNLFAYTCGIGIAAAAGGAAEVWNVDFAGSALSVGQRSAALNGIDEEVFKTLRADVIPTMRQLAGLPIKGRGRRRQYMKFEPRQFDLIVLDPPTWAKSPFGAVDPVRDYSSLLKPCVLACEPGGRILATNHVSTVNLEPWLETLRRSVSKSGRALEALEVILPETDFPSPDNNPPMKMAVLTIR